MPLALLGLGSNLGNRADLLMRGINLLGSIPGIRLRGASPWLESPPLLGPADQSPYLNGCVLIECGLSPHDLLRAAHDVEHACGRIRQERWSARTLDIDLLLFGELVVDHPSLAIPHPRMIYRRFVLEPAAAIAGEMIHPTTGWTVQALWEHWQRARGYLALCHGAAITGSTLARDLLERMRLTLFDGASWMLRSHEFFSLHQELSGRTPDEHEDRVDAVPSSSGPEHLIPGTRLERTIRFLEDCGRPLTGLRQTPLMKPLVTDFWLDALGSALKDVLREDEQQILENVRQRLQRETCQPDIVIVHDETAAGQVTSPRNVRWPSLRMAVRDDAACREELQAAMTALCQRPEQSIRPNLHPG